MTPAKKMHKLNEVQEVAAIREQLQFFKYRLAKPMPAGIAQQLEEALQTLGSGITLDYDGGPVAGTWTHSGQCVFNHGRAGK